MSYVMIYRKVIIHIGGLTDGLLPLPYTTALADRAELNGWAFAQPLLSSSHLGYGISSLQKDSDEIDLLIQFFARKWEWDSSRNVNDTVKVVIIGHSTGSVLFICFLFFCMAQICKTLFLLGCQDAIWHSTHGKEKTRIAGVVLQVLQFLNKFIAVKKFQI